MELVADILPSPVQRQFGLGRGGGRARDQPVSNGNVQGRSNRPGQFAGLVETAFYTPFTVQRYRYEALRRIDFPARQPLCNQFTEQPAVGQGSMELQSQYQTVHRKVIEKRRMQVVESGGDLAPLAATTGLSSLKRLLAGIIRRWPDARFISTDQLSVDTGQ